MLSSPPPRHSSLAAPSSPYSPYYSDYSPGRKLSDSSTLYNNTHSRKPSFASSTSSLNLSHAEHRWSETIGSPPPQSLWSNCSSLPRTPLEQRLYKTILLRKLPVNHYSVNKDDKSCPRCGYSTETIPHFLLECPVSTQFWSRVHQLLLRILNLKIPQFSLRDIVYSFPELSIHHHHVITVIHSTAIWVLWSSRDSDSVDFVWALFCTRLRARISVEFSDGLVQAFNDNHCYSETPPMTPVELLRFSDSLLSVGFSVSQKCSINWFERMPVKVSAHEEETKTRSLFEERWCCNGSDFCRVVDGRLAFPWLD